MGFVVIRMITNSFFLCLGILPRLLSPFRIQESTKNLKGLDIFAWASKDDIKWFSCQSDPKIKGSFLEVNKAQNPTKSRQRPTDPTFEMLLIPKLRSEIAFQSLFHFVHASLF